MAVRRDEEPDVAAMDSPPGVWEDLVQVVDGELHVVEGPVVVVVPQPFARIGASHLKIKVNKPLCVCACV